MASTSETGHAKNVANFQELIAFSTAYGATYNPSKNALKIPQLIALKTLADAKLNNVVNVNTQYNIAVNERMIAFSGLKAYATRLVNALQTTDASTETINNAKAFNRKMQGKRASATPTATDPNTPAPTTISTSQLSYDQLIQHLSGLNAVLAAEPSYAPNETELQVATVQTKIAELIAKNNAVATAYANISNARIDRNETLYHPENGLVETALDVKKYVKSIFGASSPQFAQIKSLTFTKYKA
jgi:hypothetical protein